MQVDRCSFYGVVAKQLRNSVEIVTFIEEMGGEAVTQGVQAALLG